jgi:hypothetical protein
MEDAEIDRMFPHQVILPPAYYSGALFRAIHTFCLGLSLAERGHVVLRNDEWHYVFCFSEWNDADKLRARYGGQWFKGGGGAIVEECTAPQNAKNSAPR